MDDGSEPPTTTREGGFSPDDRVRVEQGPLRGLVTTVAFRDDFGMVLIRLERGTFARLHEYSLSRLE